TCSLYHYPSPPASSTLSLHDALPICPDPLAKCFTPTDFATCCVCVPLRTPQPFGSIMVTLLPRGKNNSFLSLTKASCLGPVCASLTIARVFSVKRPFASVPVANLTGLITEVLPPNCPRTLSIPVIPLLISPIESLIASRA